MSDLPVGARVNTCPGYVRTESDDCLFCGHSVLTHDRMHSQGVEDLRRAADDCLTEHMNEIEPVNDLCGFCGVKAGTARDFHGRTCPQRLIFALSNFDFMQVRQIAPHPSQVSYIWEHSKRRSS